MRTIRLWWRRSLTWPNACRRATCAGRRRRVRSRQRHVPLRALQARKTSAPRDAAYCTVVQLLQRGDARPARRGVVAAGGAAVCARPQPHRAVAAAACQRRAVGRPGDAPHAVLRHSAPKLSSGDACAGGTVSALRTSCPDSVCSSRNCCVMLSPAPQQVGRDAVRGGSERQVTGARSCDRRGGAAACLLRAVRLRRVALLRTWCCCSRALQAAPSLVGGQGWASVGACARARARCAALVRGTRLRASCTKAACNVGEQDERARRGWMRARMQASSTHLHQRCRSRRRTTSRSTTRTGGARSRCVRAARARARTALRTGGAATRAWHTLATTRHCSSGALQPSRTHTLDADTRPPGARATALRSGRVTAAEAATCAT